MSDTDRLAAELPAFESEWAKRWNTYYATEQDAPEFRGDIIDPPEDKIMFSHVVGQFLAWALPGRYAWCAICKHYHKRVR